MAASDNDKGFFAAPQGHYSLVQFLPKEGIYFVADDVHVFPQFPRNNSLITSVVVRASERTHLHRKNMTVRLPYFLYDRVLDPPFAASTREKILGSSLMRDENSLSLEWELSQHYFQ